VYYQSDQNAPTKDSPGLIRQSWKSSSGSMLTTPQGNCGWSSIWPVPTVATRFSKNSPQPLQGCATWWTSQLQRWRRRQSLWRGRSGSWRRSLAGARCSETRPPSWETNWRCLLTPISALSELKNALSHHFAACCYFAVKRHIRNHITSIFMGEPKLADICSPNLALRSNI